MDVRGGAAVRARHDPTLVQTWAQRGHEAMREVEHGIIPDPSRLEEISRSFGSLYSLEQCHCWSVTYGIVLRSYSICATERICMYVICGTNYANKDDYSRLTRFDEASRQ